MFEVFYPTSADIEKLIVAARKHPLGTEFLLNGDLCAVATIFGVHVFTVEAARDQWKLFDQVKRESDV